MFTINQPLLMTRNQSYHSAGVYAHHQCCAKVKCGNKGCAQNNPFWLCCHTHTVKISMRILHTTMAIHILSQFPRKHHSKDKQSKSWDLLQQKAMHVGHGCSERRLTMKRRKIHCSSKTEHNVLSKIELQTQENHFFFHMKLRSQSRVR